MESNAKLAMKLTEPARYHVSIVPESDGKLFQIKPGDGKPKFSKPATSNLPKLYIVTVEGQKAPIYVEITKQSMRTRLRLGCTADGRTGYHGYAWRPVHPEVALDLWCNTDPDAQKSWRDIETVEAEIVFLIRQMSVAIKSDRDSLPSVRAIPARSRRNGREPLSESTVDREVLTFSANVRKLSQKRAICL